MNEEILAKARAAKSPEELLKLAHDNGMSEFNEENAKAYFEVMHHSGELSDDELEQAAGGCKRGGRRIVSLGNICPGNFWQCKKCLLPSSNCLCKEWSRHPDSFERAVGVTMNATMDSCSTCGWCSYEKGTWYCNNDNANKV